LGLSVVTTPALRAMIIYNLILELSHFLGKAKAAGEKIPGERSGFY